MLKLHWDNLDKQSRTEILCGACIQERFQHYEWDEMDDWLKCLIKETTEVRSGGTATVC